MLSDEFSRILDANQSGLAAIEGNLLSAAKGTDIKSIFVTSSRSGEGKTVTAITLAHALVTTTPEKVVLVVDASLRKPRLHEAFQLDGGAPGLMDLLRSDTGLDKVVQDTGIDRLSAITIGSRDHENIPAHVIPSAACEKQLAEMRNRFGFVVFDGDAVFTSSNAAVLARHFDGVALVAECERTKWEVVDLARQKITDVGGRVIGVILNKRKYYIPSGLHEKL